MTICLATLPALAEVDAVASAFVNDFYSDRILEGDELLYLRRVKMEDKHYPRLGLSPNQTTTNVDAGSELVSVF